MRIRDYNNSHAIIMLNNEKEFKIIGNRLKKYERIKSKSKRARHGLKNTEARYNKLWENIYIPF